MECLAVSGGGKIQNHLHLDPKGGHIGGRATVAKEVKFGYGKHPLLQVEGKVKPIGGKDGEQCPQVLLVLLLGFAEHAIII